MIISDLNYLEVANEEVVGGILLGTVSSNAATTLTVTETLAINKSVVSTVATVGRVGTAEVEIIGTNSGVAQTFVTIAPGLISSSSIGAAGPV